MSKKLGWLDNFAEEQAIKTASTKNTQRVIVDVDTVKNAKNGENVKLDKVNYKVINASFEDDKGLGILLEKTTCPECSKEECECKKSKVAMVAQEYAHMDPGNVYHIEVRDDVEQPKFEQSAIETAQAIAQEDSIDGTSGGNKPNRILNKAKEIMTPVMVEEPTVEEVEEVEFPAVEKVEVEVPVEENTEDSDEDVKAVANKIAKAVEDEIEAILEETELAVKETIPAKYVKSTLASLEKAIEAEGICPLFDKKVSREMLRKTAGKEVGEDKIREFVASITEAVVEDVEDVLKDADEISDETVATFKNKAKVEAILKSTIETVLAAKGINFKLARLLVAEEENEVAEDIEEVADLGALKKSLEHALKSVEKMIEKEV